MKRKSIFLSLLLIAFCAISTFALTGCGSDLKNLAENFNKIATAYQQTYASSFKEGSVGGITTKYKVDYGNVINDYITSEKEGFTELADTYNVMLAISNSYIDSNKTYLLDYDQKNLTKSAKKAINNLNSSTKSYLKALETFIKEKNSFVNFFENISKGTIGDPERYHLKIFKKAYAQFLSANIDISSNLAKTLEETEMFDLLRAGIASARVAGIVKDYVETKVLVIFNEFLINQTNSVMDWNIYVGKNPELDNLYNSYINKFDTYKTKLVNAGTNYKATFQPGEMGELLDKVNNFFVESEDFYKAAQGIDFPVLAKTYDNNVDEYTNKENKMAKIQLAKLKQFIDITVPNFIDEVVEYLYI